MRDASRHVEAKNHSGADHVLQILLIDDHELFRAGFKLLLAELDDAPAFAEAPDCATALALSQGRRFDLVLLDLNLPGHSGLEALRLIRETFEDATVVVLSGENEATMIRQIIDAGAAGFIPKNSTPRVMMAALRLVLAGGTYLPPHVLSSAASPEMALARTVNSKAYPGAVSPGPLSQLSERQMDCLRRAMQGKPNKVIARELDISEATVKVHLAVAFRVLGVKNRTEAVFTAARAGLSI